ncbi:MAG: GNAT family N-acetyltransferase [Bacteroidota bacterium]|jgi:GNAT superfamily N-acetyltransferase
MNPFFVHAGKADAALIRELARKAWIPTYAPILSEDQLAFMFEEWYSISGIEKSMQDGQHFVLMFLGENNPAGYASYSMESAGQAKLNKIYVDPDYKGKGFGKSLIKHIEMLLKNAGKKMLFLNVNRYNSAVHFYEACGYAITREEDIPIGKFWMNDFVMEKEL